ncbi:MAG: YncE family protein [Longimicrobiales bacterium]
MGIRTLLTGAAMAGVLAVAACEGDNLFSVPGGGGPVGADAKAPTVDISVPRGDSLSGTAIGDSVFVSVHVTDKVGVTSLTITGFALRGDAGLGTLQTVERFAEKTVDFAAGVKDTTLSRYLLAAEDTTREKAYVVVTARDSAGNVTADTASFSVGGPVVLLSGFKDGDVVSSGADLAATIKATDPKGVNELRLEITGSLERALVKTFGTSQTSVQLDTATAIPDTAAGPIMVQAAARNTLGVIERTPGVLLFIADRKSPTTTILIPRGDSLSAKPLGDSVLVTARLTDNFGVRSVRMKGIAKRGSKDLGTDTVVLRFVERAVTFAAGVKDTTISRYLRATADSTKETAQIVVIAADSAGNQSSDTVDLVLGGPDVEILDIVDGQTIQAGLGLTARVRAQDPLGITQIRIEIRGALDTTIVKAITPPADSVVVDTTIAIPVNTLGPLQITAIARNALDVAGQDGPLSMIVVPPGAGDTIRPVLRHVSSAPARMELQDSVTIQVTGTDQGGGVAKVGYTVLAISPKRGDTLVASDSAAFDPARTGTVTRFFKFAPFNVDSLNLPDTLIYEITSWMRDAQGNCAASVGLDSLASLPCDTLATGEVVAMGRGGQRVTRSVVAGKTVLLPAGGKIMDAAVDTARRRLYLSNIGTNQLEVFDLVGERFNTAIGVGSEPWGVAFSRDNDSLWVANSGGANLSVVDLDAGVEVDSDRLLTPDVLLFNVELKSGEGSIQYIVTPLPQAEPPAFSDRPQFVAVDSFGNVIYSTKTSEIGDLGTARKAFFEPGWERSEAKIFVEHGLLNPQEDFWALAHIDSIETAVDTLSVDSLGVAMIAARMAIYDHVPGFPNQVIVGVARSDALGAVEVAAADLVAAGSDVRVVAGHTWNIGNLAFKDTTYVAASGDGGWVGIGEGGSEPVGRVLMYRAAPSFVTSLSRWIQVSNLLNNPSEEVRGLGLNYDGTMAVVRGRLAAYFVTPADLITQGQTLIPNALQGSGAALHPLHANARTLDNLAGQYRPDTHLAFVASGDRTVDIIDTQRFTRVGRLYIRDVVTGPLRAVLPFPADNTGNTCATMPVTDRAGRLIGDAIQIYDGGSFNTPIAADGITEDRCVVMKLFATTSGGGVVVIDVRKADVFREHPARR